MKKIVKLIMGLVIFGYASSFAQSSNLGSLHNYKQPSHFKQNEKSKVQMFVNQASDSGSILASSSSSNYKVPASQIVNELVLRPIYVSNESELSNFKVSGRNYKTSGFSSTLKSNQQEQAPNNLNKKLEIIKEKQRKEKNGKEKNIFPTESIQ